MDLARLGEIGRSQDGLITRCQALKFLSENQLATLLRRKILEDAHRGVYTFQGSPRTWTWKVRAAVMSRSGSLASHRTAARLWGLLDYAPSKPDILLPHSADGRGAGIVVHRTTAWHDAIGALVNDIPTTTVARTLIDLSSCVSRDRLASAIDTALVLRLTALDDIADELILIGTKGRSRISVLQELLAVRDERFEMLRSVSEVRWLERFDKHGLPRAIPEYRVVLDQQDTALFDFAYPEQKLAIEVLSWRWHGGPSKFEADLRRKAKARILGWEIIEVGWKTFETLGVAAIKAALRSRPAPNRV